jgi:DNA-binding IclR family transcriptional regulator
MKPVVAPSHDSPPVLDAAAAPRGTVKSAVRVLSILETFDDVRRPMRAGEIAARLDYPQSSTSYLLRDLVDLGYLDYDPVARTYIPTPRVALLGTWTASNTVSAGPLVRLARQAALETRRTITLAVRNGIHACYIHVQEPGDDPPLHVPIGTRRLLAWSASGFAILTAEREERIRPLVQRTNAEARMADPPLNAATVLAHVRRCRGQGWFFSDGMVTPGHGHVAMLLPPSMTDGRTVAIGVAGRGAGLRHGLVEVVGTLRRLIETVECEMKGDSA